MDGVKHLNIVFSFLSGIYGDKGFRVWGFMRNPEYLKYYAYGFLILATFRTTETPTLDPSRVLWDCGN